MERASRTTTDAACITLGLLDDLIGREEDGRVGVRLWDGTCWPDAAAALLARVVERSNGLADHVYARVLERRLLGIRREMVQRFLAEHGDGLMGGPLPYEDT